MSKIVDPVVHAWEQDNVFVEHYRYPVGPAAPMEPHVHDSHQICFSPDTAGEYRLGRRSFAVPAGSVSFVAAGEKHVAVDRPDRVRPAAFWMIYVRPSRWERLTGNTAAAPVIVHHRDVYTRISSLPGRIARAATRLECEASLGELCAAFHRPLPAPSRVARRRLEQVRDYLAAVPEDNPSLAELAMVAGLSPWHFNREFRRHYRVPPHVFLLQARVAAAKRRILGGQPLAEAALAVGFADQSHFNRVFRRATGTTPGRYVQGSKIVQDR